MPKKIILFPFGGNARESLACIFAINRTKKEWDVLGFIDDDRFTWDKDCCGVKVIGDREVLKKFPNAKVLAVPGNPADYLKRKEIIESLHVTASRFATIIHPTVVISPDAKIGHNTLLMPNIFIGCGVKIGNHCIVLPNTVISHDSVIDDYCCIGSNVSVSGKVSIGSNCYIGSGVKIREYISIGERTIIGIGSTVISNVEERVVAAGNPARILRKAN